MRRLAIVTGASRGIGRETALLLAQSDCDLILVARTETELQQTARECRQSGATVTVIAADLTEGCECAKLIKQAAQASDAYTVLINIAGMAEFGSFDQQSWETFEAHLRLNFLAGAMLCHYVLPSMLKRGGGQIVNVLSIAATHPFSGASAYCASKAAFQMFSKVISLEYRARGIKVTSVIPGSVDTPLWDKNEWKPNPADMLKPTAVAEAIRDIVTMPPDRNVDELVLMPPNGIL